MYNDLNGTNASELCVPEDLSTTIRRFGTRIRQVVFEIDYGKFGAVLPPMFNLIYFNGMEHF